MNLNVIEGGDDVFIQVWGQPFWLSVDVQTGDATFTKEPSKASRFRLVTRSDQGTSLMLGNTVNLKYGQDGYLDIDYFRGFMGDFILRNRLLLSHDANHSLWTFSVPFDERRQQHMPKAVRYGERVQMLHVVSDLWLRVNPELGEIHATKLLTQASFFMVLPAVEMWTCADKDSRMCLETSGTANLDLGLYRGTRNERPFLTGLFTRAGHRVFVKDEGACSENCRTAGWRCSGSPNFKCVQDMTSDQSFDDCFMSCWPDNRSAPD